MLKVLVVGSVFFCNILGVLVYSLLGYLSGAWLWSVAFPLYVTQANYADVRVLGWLLFWPLVLAWKLLTASLWWILVLVLACTVLAFLFALVEWLDGRS